MPPFLLRWVRIRGGFRLGAIVHVYRDDAFRRSALLSAHRDVSPPCDVLGYTKCMAERRFPGVLVLVAAFSVAPCGLAADPSRGTTVECAVQIELRHLRLGYFDRPCIG
jgi:hypothetical protein